MEKVQTMSEKTKNWNWSMVTPLKGLWKMQKKKQKSEFFFDYGQTVF